MTDTKTPLLDEETTARIKSKEVAQQAATERRKKEVDDAHKLADAQRREELRRIPAAQRTEEERLEFQRLEMRRYRAGAKKGDALSQVATAAEFWKANRLTVNPPKIREWKEKEERVKDLEFYMAWGWECSPDDGVVHFGSRVNYVGRRTCRRQWSVIG